MYKQAAKQNNQQHVLLWQANAMPGMAIRCIADSKITCAVPAGRLQCHGRGT